MAADAATFMTILAVGETSGLGRVTSVSAHGNKGAGIYSLYLCLECTVNVSQKALLSQLHCRIELGDGGPILGSGSLEGSPIREWSQYHTDERLGFYFQLTATQISAIEKYRCAGDLKLGVWLSGVIQYDQETAGFYDKAVFTVPQQQWVQALQQMGYADKLLYEIPIPTTHNKQIKSLIYKAQSHILNGHYDEAVSQCRHLFELYESDLAKTNKAKEAIEQYKVKRRDMDISQRLTFARESVKNITHISAHFTGEDSFSRNQAIQVLNLTLAVLYPEEGEIS